MFTQLLLGDITPIPVRSRIEWLLAIAEKMRYTIQLVDGCCEPGYDDKPVALGNWNERIQYNPKTSRSRTTDDTMPRLAKLFGQLGYAVEWEDEWIVCDSCGKAVRNSPDSYSWKQYYWYNNCTVICGDCIKADPADYLEWLSGNPKRALTFDIDLSKYGYSRHSGNYKNGWHPGQDDNPLKIAKQLREEDITDFIFTLDYKGQFDLGFSVWVNST